MSNEHEYVIAVIGAGPRGTSFMERLLARVERSSPGKRRKLRVMVFDPAPHGPGRVWDPEQSRLYLMNTPASYPTAAPSAGTQGTLPASSCSVSFLEYCRTHGLKDEDAAYPARSDYGTYLTWLSKEVSAHLRGRGVTVDHICSEVTGLRHEGHRYSVTTSLTKNRADAVILAVGHLEAELASGPAHLADQAEQLGLHYQGPAIPTAVDYRSLGAQETVLVRGMGLNFFDLMIQVSAGRGGEFRVNEDAEPGHRYSYLPSGDEPRLIAGSRRGTPYRSKTVAPGFVPQGIELVHLSDEAIHRLVQQHAGGQLPGLDFSSHLWPLVEQDVAATYAQFGGEDEFDIRAFARPFQGRYWSSPAKYQEAMLAWLEHDAAASAAGASSPEKMAVNALHAARLKIKRLVTEKLIRPESVLRDVEGWFEPLVEGLASGPPLQRIEELAALARAGVVEFLGPEPAFGVDGAREAFIADSAAVQGARYRAEHLLEAMMPPNRVTQARSPLLRGLLEEGLAVPATIESGGQAHVHKGFEVTEQPHRLVTADGSAGRIYVLGLQLSSVQWGTAIAAEAGGDHQGTARTLADADAAAAEVLAAAGLSS
ncbi:FAD/NAD(P)-binding protein [Nesterenkonia muleiensis]|uniref:FAD/NAD(P)-binding protein n=1 Tax=Nesterenkonia muleiensis TaxID=2282648 RepID=UPI000E70D723|nr:FAD/NAD(P)-binding protein [Nesterenkonia muleiensis]